MLTINEGVSAKVLEALVCKVVSVEDRRIKINCHQLEVQEYQGKLSILFQGAKKVALLRRNQVVLPKRNPVVL
tara:strand:+ start:113 stop:331 length:219 start_codon:yes stop_codon:yes gene_type:complete